MYNFDSSLAESIKKQNNDNKITITQQLLQMHYLQPPVKFETVDLSKN